ncbi:MAG: HD domain-containing phosphohydrolase [Smithella sp.]
MKDQIDHICFEDIFETVREPVLVLNLDLMVVSANSNFYHTFKVTPNKTIGRIIYDLGKQQWNIPGLRTLLEEILKKENCFDDYEVEHVFPDIGHKIMLLNARRITLEGICSRLILLAIEDVTQSRRLENIVEESEDRYRHICETAGDGILLLEKSKGAITHANLAVKAMLGYSRKECIGKKLTDIGFAEGKCDIQEILRTLEREGIIYYNDTSIKNKAGQDIDVDVCMINNSRFIQCNIRDITGRKQTEEDIKQNFLRTRKALEATIHAISSLAEQRDPYVAGHQHRVADLACAIATQMGLTTDRIEGISMAAAIHDIGKISIPADILGRPTKLTGTEFNFIKTHAKSGYDILKDIKFPWPIARMIIEHHERMNGSGYPKGLSKDSTLLESRILAVADVVEAMTSRRPYRPSLGIDAALNEITRNKSILYDPEVVDTCLRIFKMNNYKFGS